MAKYLQRSCPKCNGYLGIVVPERKAKMPVQAIIFIGDFVETASPSVTRHLG